MAEESSDSDTFFPSDYDNSETDVTSDLDAFDDYVEVPSGQDRFVSPVSSGIVPKMLPKGSTFRPIYPNISQGGSVPQRMVNPGRKMQVTQDMPIIKDVQEFSVPSVSRPGTNIVRVPAPSMGGTAILHSGQQIKVVGAGGQTHIKSGAAVSASGGMSGIATLAAAAAQQGNSRSVHLTGKMVTTNAGGQPTSIKVVGPNGHQIITQQGMQGMKMTQMTSMAQTAAIGGQTVRLASPGETLLKPGTALTGPGGKQIISQKQGGSQPQIVTLVKTSQGKQEKKNQGKSNINTKFDLQGNGEMKPLKHWILEACFTSLEAQMEELRATRKPGIQWTTMFGVEAVWNENHVLLKENSFTQSNLKKSIDRCINAQQKRPLTGMGDIGDTDPELLPSREEANEDTDDAYTKELVQKVVNLRSVLETDMKEVKESSSKRTNRNNWKLRVNDIDDEDDCTSKQVPVGLDTRKRVAGEQRRKATFALGQPDGGQKRSKPTVNSEDKTDGIEGVMSSITKLAEQRIRSEQERMQFEREEREAARREREEEREMKRREREEKEERKKKEKDMEESMAARIEQLKAEQEERDNALKKWLGDLINKK